MPANLSPDEKASAEAAHDIMANVTGGDTWREYDEKYVRQRILRAIREVGGKASK